MDGSGSIPIEAGGGGVMGVRENKMCLKQCSALEKKEERGVERGRGRWIWLVFIAM